MRMQVWIINQFAGNRESGWGERHFFLAKELLKKQCDVLIISSASNHLFHNTIQSNRHFTDETYEGVRFCWVKVPRYNPQSVLRFWSMGIFALKLFFFPIRRYRIPTWIIVSSMPMFPVIPCLFWKWKLKCRKFAFEVRDLWPLTPIYLGNISTYNPMVLLMKLIEKIAYRKSDLILSLLPRAHEYINLISESPRKFMYLPNGFSEEVNTDEMLPFDLSAVIPEKKFIVGYVGTLGLANAMTYVIQAAKLIKDETDICFIILGDGYLKDDLICEAHGLDNVKFLPKIKKGMVARVVACFDVCILSWHKSPLYQYGISPNKLFDYMYASKPIILAGDIPDNPVESAKCGICVEPENPEAIKQAILKFFSMDKAERDRYGKNGRNFLSLFHSYPILAEKLYAKLTE